MTALSLQSRGQMDSGPTISSVSVGLGDIPIKLVYPAMMYQNVVDNGFEGSTSQQPHS